MNDSYGFTEEAGHAVDRIEQFPFDDIDTLKDRIAEAMAHGNGALTNLINELISEREAERTGEAISRILCLLAEAKRPRMKAAQLAWVVNMGTNLGKSLPALAHHFGVSKQTFSQGAQRLAKRLGLPATRAMRLRASVRAGMVNGQYPKSWH